MHGRVWAQKRREPLVATRLKQKLSLWILFGFVGGFGFFADDLGSAVRFAGGGFGFAVDADRDADGQAGRGSDVMSDDTDDIFPAIARLDRVCDLDEGFCRDEFSHIFAGGRVHRRVNGVAAIDRGDHLIVGEHFAQCFQRRLDCRA